MYNISMYIIELIAKLIKNKNNKSPQKPSQEETDYENTCEHTFFPIDSTGETLACTKCGVIIKKDSMKIIPKNPFA